MKWFKKEQAVIPDEATLVKMRDETLKLYNVNHLYRITFSDSSFIDVMLNGIQIKQLQEMLSNQWSVTNLNQSDADGLLEFGITFAHVRSIARILPREKNEATDTPSN